MRSIKQKEIIKEKEGVGEYQMTQRGRKMVVNSDGEGWSRFFRILQSSRRFRDIDDFKEYVRKNSDITDEEVNMLIDKWFEAKYNFYMTREVRKGIR